MILFFFVKHGLIRTIHKIWKYKTMKVIIYVVIKPEELKKEGLVEAYLFIIDKI
jgi:hypothetical protein